MITSGFAYLAVLIALGGLILYLEKRRNLRVFKWVPGIVFLYIGAAALNTAGAFGESDSIETVGGGVQDALLPAMILLLLFSCDIRQIVKLGPRLLLTYAVAAASIVVSFAVVFLLLQSFYAPETWRAFAGLAASWTGGSANMVAVQGIVNAPETLFGYALVMDTINYSVWLMVVFAAVPWAPAFNRWVKADDSYLKDFSQNAEEAEQSTEKRPIDTVSILGLLGLGLLASATANWVGGLLPEIDPVVNQTTWTILLVSILGLVIAVTPLGKAAGSMELGNVLLYVIVGILASGADFSQLGQAPIYLASGFLILLLHAAIMLVYAKLTKADLFSIGVASVANIGGVASAPIIASAFHRNLVSVGVLTALIGSFLGTYLGLLAGQIMSIL